MKIAFNNSSILLFMIVLSCTACAAQMAAPVSVYDISRIADSYAGNSVSVEGYLFIDVLHVPHLYNSVEDATRNKDSAAIDVISDNRNLYKSLKTDHPVCMIVSGIFHNNSDSIHTGVSRIGLIDVKSVKKCE